MNYFIFIGREPEIASSDRKWTRMELQTGSESLATSHYIHSFPK